MVATAIPEEREEEINEDEEDALIAAVMEEESEDPESEPEEEENWPESYYEEIGISQLESATEPSFDMLMPVLLPADDLEEGAARDPERVAREEYRAKKIADRKAARRLVK